MFRSLRVSGFRAYVGLCERGYPNVWICVSYRAELQKLGGKLCASFPSQPDFGNQTVNGMQNVGLVLAFQGFRGLGLGLGFTVSIVNPIP